MNLLQLLREDFNMNTWEIITCTAARHGHIDNLEWNHTEQDVAYLLTQWLVCLLTAAEAGRLDVLPWARANGCPWTAQTCSRAAEDGHLEVLQ